MWQKTVFLSCFFPLHFSHYSELTEKGVLQRLSTEIDGHQDKVPGTQHYVTPDGVSSLVKHYINKAGKWMREYTSAFANSCYNVTGFWLKECDCHLIIIVFISLQVTVSPFLDNKLAWLEQHSHIKGVLFINIS